MKTKRFISILITLTMVLGLFSGLTVAASATESTEETNPYDDNVYAMLKKGGIDGEALTSSPLLLDDSDGDGIYTGSCLVTFDAEDWIVFCRCDSQGNQLGIRRWIPVSAGKFEFRFEYEVETDTFYLPDPDIENDLSSAEISVPGTYTYTGEAIEPAVEVTFYGETLEIGTDYTVEYSDNVNAGTATVAVSGIGDYHGEGTSTFEIGKATIEGKTEDKYFHYTRKTLTIDLKELFPDVDFENAGYSLVRSAEGITPYVDDAVLIIGIDENYTAEDAEGNPEINSAELTISSTNHEDFVYTVNLHITEKTDISDKLICETMDVTYNGQDNLPTASFADDFVAGENGELSYFFLCDGFETTDAVDAGHYEGTIIYEDDTYYGEKTVEFDVLPAVPVLRNIPSTVIAGKDEILENVSVTGVEAIGVDGEPIGGRFAWHDWEKVITEDSVERVRFISHDANYSAVEFDVEVDCVDFENVIFVGNIPLEDGEYLTNDGEIQETKPSSGGYACYKNGILTLNDYVYEGEPDERECTDYEEYYETVSAVIYALSNLEIKLVGESCIVNYKNENGTGIYCPGNLTIGGKGLVAIDTCSGEDGIYVIGDLTIKGGTVDIDADDDGIMAAGDVNITGGTVDIKTNDDDGIEANGSINISGGNIIVDADDNGILVTPLHDVYGELIRNNGDITISGGTINIKSGDECIKTNNSYDADDEECGGGNIIISGGEITADSETADAIEADRRGDNEETGNIKITGGKLHFEVGYSGIEADGELEIDNADIYILSRVKDEIDMGIIAADGITLGKGVEISKPTGGKIGENSVGDYTVVKKNGEVADEIQISVVKASSNKGSSSSGGSRGSSGSSFTVGGAPINPVPQPGILPSAPEAKAFEDVANHWAKTDVDYALKNGLMNGVSDTSFDPDGELTRGMLVTVLYRMEGEPAVNRSIPFADVDMGMYYANAIIWAQQNGIVKGITETEFAPDERITREQIAAIMYRYAEHKGYDVGAGADVILENYDDFGAVHQYAIAPVKYAIGSGLMKGRTERTLEPRSNATRAEIAVILHRFVEANGK